MTRVYRQRSAPDRTRAVRKKKPYKVVMEAVTQEKKKLHSVMTYTANAPRGYTFVPLGNRDLTEYCKERCRKRNLTAHIVSAKPKGRVAADPQREDALRIDTQRIGHHFPNEIIDEACDALGYSFRHGVFQKVTRNYEETRLARSLRDYGQRMLLHGRPATEKETKDQIRSAILEVFPKIPGPDLEAIVGHAFEEGTNRVGNATDLTLARRVQLAVGAYIRHQYTDYDNILKTGGTWPEARQKAQPISYAKLREWRDEGDSNELEETFREIIVLDDDEDDDDSETSEESPEADEREHSLEIISSQATARELQPEDWAGAARVDAHGVSRHPRRLILLRPARPVPSSSVLVRPSYTHPAQQVTRVHARPLSAEFSANPAPLRPIERRPNPVALEPLRPARPASHIQMINGQLYNLEPVDPIATGRPGASGSPMVEYLPSSRSGYAHRPQRVKSLDIHTDRPAPSRRQSGEDIVLPSIEREPVQSPKKRVFPESTYDDGDRYYEPSHSAMFNRLHYREPIDTHSRSYITTPARGYVAQRPEYHRTSERYTHAEYSAPRETLIRPYAGDGRYHEEDLHYVPRALH